MSQSIDSLNLLTSKLISKSIDVVPIYGANLLTTCCNLRSQSIENLSKLSQSVVIVPIYGPNILSLSQYMVPIYHHSPNLSVNVPTYPNCPYLLILSQSIDLVPVYVMIETDNKA